MKDINATVIISNLDRSEKKIFKSLNKDARWGINRAKKYGVYVEESNSKKDWDEFYEIYKKIMKIGKTDVFEKEDLQKISEVFLVCKKESEVIGGGIIWFGDRYKKEIPRLHSVASDNDYWNYQPNNLIYWECIMWAKKNGYNAFDFGGWQINARGHLIGINKFKEKWGDVIIYKKDYPIAIAIGRKLIRNSRFFRFMWDKIKKRK